MQKGFEFLAQEFDGIKYPNLLYHQVASYGQESEVGHGDKRFFVDIYLFKYWPRREVPTYQIEIRTFHGTDYFKIPEATMIPNDPFQKALNEIEKLL